MMSRIESSQEGPTSGQSGRSGWVYDIQRFSVHDGPGIRTTVFLKGCPLSCLWCANPESQSISPQILYFEDHCVSCYRCLIVCPREAISTREDGKLFLDHQRCERCGACVEKCLSGSRAMCGKTMSVEEVYSIIRKDRIYYQNSGGGVTVSGGEPTYQPDFLFHLLKTCRENGLHTCLDTCGFVSWSTLEPILKQVDLVLLDIKHMDTRRHKQFTGVNNQLILENAMSIRDQGIPIIIRVPLIPGLNDSEENMLELGEFMRTANLPRIDVLPYHQLGRNKYKALGREYLLENVPPCGKDALQIIVKKLQSVGLSVTIN